MRCALLLSLLWAGLSFAVIETYEFEDDSQRARYHRFVEELRCPKCQNQNLAGSNSPIAADLRKQLHRMLLEGKSDEQIQQYMVDRYGDFILYRPQVNRNTALLWLAPGLMLGVGLLIWFVQLRRGRGQNVARDDSLSSEEQAKLKQLLTDNDDA